MGADTKLKAALETLHPVARTHYKVKKGSNAPRTYFTFQLILGAEALHADDESGAGVSTWRIDLASRDNYAELIPKVVKALKDAQFYGITIEAEQYDPETDYYRISLNAKYFIMEEN